ncbi:winged helix-turn-helix transcriptional regulator [Staphylococcus gallinarum]|nr:winged helix-turn-helix transcriptional regulator [Staphylococcus gallinarum]
MVFSTIYINIVEYRLSEKGESLLSITKYLCVWIKKYK